MRLYRNPTNDLDRVSTEESLIEGIGNLAGGKKLMVSANRLISEKKREILYHSSIFSLLKRNEQFIFRFSIGVDA